MPESFFIFLLSKRKFPAGLAVGVFSIFTYLSVLLIVFSCTRGKDLDPQEAEKDLKVLNSDITNFISSASEQDIVKALKFIWNQPSSPLPFKNNDLKQWPDDTLFSMQTRKGRYEWLKEKEIFARTAASDSVILIFPSGDSGDNNASFIISKYVAVPGPSRPAFPLEIAATLFINGKEVLEIKHHAELEDFMPLNVMSEIRAEHLTGRFSLQRSREGDEGKMQWDFYLKAGMEEIVNGKIDFDLGYGPSSYYFKLISPHLRLFNVLIEGPLEYGKINPTSRDYINSFNKNCAISFYELPGKNRMGILNISSFREGELMDYVLRFNDGSIKPLRDYLLIIEKIMDYKY